MLRVGYTPAFIREYNKLEAPLQEEVAEKIELFKDKENHQRLKVHILHGKLKGLYSFSVNYSYRIVFEYKDKESVVLLKVGDHSVYM